MVTDAASEVIVALAQFFIGLALSALAACLMFCIMLCVMWLRDRPRKRVK